MALRRDRQCRATTSDAAIDTHIKFRSARRRTVHNGKFELTHRDACTAPTSCSTRLPSQHRNGIRPPRRQGTPILRSASEPHVQDVCNLLVRMGCPIEGWAQRLTIHGQDRLHRRRIHSALTSSKWAATSPGAITPGELAYRRRPEHLRMVEMSSSSLGVNMTLSMTPCAEPYGHTLVVGRTRTARQVRFRRR